MNMKQLLSVFFILFLLSACTRAPQTKEAYLEEYGQFIEQVQENYADFDEGDWKNQDATYELYSTEYYNQFSDELSIGEQLQIKGYGITYHAMKQKDDWKALGDFIEQIGNKGGKAVEKFLDDVGDDTEEVGDFIERIGGIVGDKFEKMAEEVEDEFEDSEEVLERFTKKAEEAIEGFVEDIEEDVKELEQKLKKE